MLFKSPKKTLIVLKMLEWFSGRPQKSEGMLDFAHTFRPDINPSIYRPPYNALKVDVWSLGATVWEMAQTQPPFYDTGVLADHWPPVDQPSLYSPAFHDFLRKTSEPASSRPRPMDLMKVCFQVYMFYLVDMSNPFCCSTPLSITHAVDLSSSSCFLSV